MRGYPIRNAVSGRSGNFAGRRATWSSAPKSNYTLNWAPSPGNLVPPGHSLTRDCSGSYAAGTYYDSAGLLKNAAVNACLQSEDLTTSPWVSSLGAGSAKNAVGRNGLPNQAWTLVDDAVGGYSGVGQTITVPVDTNTHLIKIWVKKTTGGTSPTFGVNCSISGGASVAKFIRLNTDTGVDGYGNATVTSEDDWWGVAWSMTNNGTAGNISLGFSLFPATSAHGVLADSASATGSAIVDGVFVKLNASTITTAEYSRTTTVANGAPRGTYRYPTTAPQSGQWGQLQGVTTDYFSTPNTVANDITGSLTIEARITPTSLAPANYGPIASNLNAANNRGYYFCIQQAGTGALEFGWRTSGGTPLQAFTSVTLAAAGFSANVAAWVKVTFDVSTGTVTFYKSFVESPTSSDWSLLGAPTVAGVTNIGTSGAVYTVGGFGALPSFNLFNGKIHRVKLYSGIDGTLVSNFNANDYTSGSTWTASTTGETWTRVGNATVQWPWVFDGTMIEAAATNLLKRSNNLSHADWSTVGASVSQNQTGIDGTTSAWTVTDASGGGGVGYLLPTAGIVLTAAGYTLSWRFKKTNGAQSSYPCFAMYEGASLSFAVLTVDTTNGIATPWTSYTGLNVITATPNVVDLGTHWQVALTFTATAAAGGWLPILYPAATANPTQSTGTFDPAVTGSCVVERGMLELGSAPTSYIDNNTSTSTTRSADVVSFTSTGLMADASGLAAIKGRLIAQNGAGPWALIVPASSGAGGWPLYFANTTSPSRLASYDLTNIVNYGASTEIPQPGELFSAATTWGGTTFGGALDGVNGTPSAAFDASMNLATNMRLGNNDANVPLHFVLQGLRYGISPITAPELAAMTA